VLPHVVEVEVDPLLPRRHDRLPPLVIRRLEVDLGDPGQGRDARLDEVAEDFVGGVDHDSGTGVEALNAVSESRSWARRAWGFPRLRTTRRLLSSQPECSVGR